VDFELSEEQSMLRDVSRAMLTEHSSGPRVRDTVASGRDVDEKLWSMGAELGWTGLGVPEEQGGTGQGLVELCLVAEELGRAVTPGPFIPTALVGLAVGRLGSASPHLEVAAALADGSQRATWAVAEPGTDWTFESFDTTAAAGADDVLLNGRKTLVQDAGSADWLLVTAIEEGRPALFLVDRDAAGVGIRRQRVLDETRSFYEVRLDDVRVPAGHRMSGAAEEFRRLADAATVLTCADALGTGERLLEMTIEYVKVRRQFDRAIGSFQAVKHKVTDMLMLVRGTRAATYYAAMALDAGAPDASKAATVAKSFTSDAMSRLAGEALQTHGGIGFTWEHDLHLYLRRAKTDEMLYGDTAMHRERLVSFLAAEQKIAR
jgi:alkylation response protein AidB-like acyl-CoA dehydrogenase